MARPNHSHCKESRNQLLRQEFAAEVLTGQQLAAKYNITRQRLYQILGRQRDRPKHNTKKARNRQLWRDYAVYGLKPFTLAAKYRLSLPRVLAILAFFENELGGEDGSQA